VDDRLRCAIPVLAQQFNVDPQTKRMIVAENFDAAVGTCLTLLNVLLRHAGALGDCWELSWILPSNIKVTKQKEEELS